MAVATVPLHVSPAQLAVITSEEISRYAEITAQLSQLEALQKDIDVRIDNNTLTVHGERKIEKEEKEENFRRVERQYGSFTRSFTLPSSVDPGQVSADYDNGVLKIKLAKKAEAKPKQIKVNLGGEKTLEARAPEAKAPGKAA